MPRGMCQDAARRPHPSRLPSHTGNSVASCDRSTFGEMNHERELLVHQEKARPDHDRICGSPLLVAGATSAVGHGDCIAATCSPRTSPPPAQSAVAEKPHKKGQRYEAINVLARSHPVATPCHRKLLHGWSYPRYAHLGDFHRPDRTLRWVTLGGWSLRRSLDRHLQYVVRARGGRAVRLHQCTTRVGSRRLAS